MVTLMSQTLNGALLGVPISASLIAITSVVRWRATKYAPPANKPTEECAVDKALEAVKAEDQKKKPAWWFLPMVYLVSGGIGFSLQYLPDWSSVLLWASCAAFIIACSFNAVLNDVTGVLLSGIARRIDDRRDIVYNSDHVSAWKRTPPGLLVAACMIGATLLRLDTSAVQLAICTVLAVVLPYRFGLLTFMMRGKPICIKWFVFGITAVVTFSTIVGGAFAVAMIFVFSKFGATEEKPNPPIVDSPTKEAGLRLIPLILISQLFMIVGMYGCMFATLYKVDWILASKRQGVKLDSDEHEDRELFSDYPAQYLEAKNEKEREMLAQMGPVIALPSLMSLIRSGQIRQFIVRPVYTLTAVFAFQMVIFSSSTVGRSLLAMDIFAGTEPGKATMEQMEGVNHLSALIAVFLAPLGMAFALGVVSFFRGETGMVFNYCSEPLPYLSPEGGMLSPTDEKESFEKELPADKV